MTEKKLNLIPEELKVSRKTIRFITVLNKASLLGIIFFLISLFAFVSFNFYYLTESNKLSQSVDDLKSRVVSLEKNEQKLILTKDKLSKLKMINEKPSVVAEIEKINELTQGLGGTSIIDNVKLTSERIETSFNLNTVNELDIFIEKIKSITGYKLISIPLLAFKPESVVHGSLVFSNK